MLTVLLSHDRVGQEAHVGFKSMKGLKNEEGKILARYWVVILLVNPSEEWGHVGG